MASFALASLALFLPVRLGLNTSAEGVAHKANVGRGTTDRFRVTNS